MPTKRTGSNATSSHKSERRETPPTTRIVFVTAMAVAVALIAGQGWLTLLLTPAPLVYYLIRPPRDKRVDLLVLRWVPALLVLLTMSAAFAGPRLSQSVITGTNVYANTISWLAGHSAAPFGLTTLLWIFLTFALGVVVAGTAGGAIIAGVAVGITSVSAAVVCSSGYNLIQIGLVALSPWQWSFLSGLTLILLATCGHSISPGDTVSRVNSLRADRRLLIGIALVVLAFLLRLLLANGYTSLVQRWTAH